MSAPSFTHRQKLSKLRDEHRDRVMERAAILHADGGLTWDEADALAFEIEAKQPALPGMGDR